MWALGRAEFEYDKITLLFQLKQGNGEFELKEVPVKKQTKVGFTLTYEDEVVGP